MKDLPPQPDPRSRIPSINKMVERMVGVLGDVKLPRPLAVSLARLLADFLRAHPGAQLTDALIRTRVAPLLQPGPTPVINGTGILLHTNLGRSPLSREVLDAALDRVAGYTDLELDLDSGKRGHRDRHFSALARLAWGVEDATLVNNAAAAVALTLAALAANGETVVSRGELIEIGGSFRIPDIMNLAGTRLHEVGTTNKTKPEDYRLAINQRTACLLKTHTSNYRIEGFTGEVPLDELVRLGRKHHIPVVMDLGSGLSSSLPFPEVPEPFIEDYLEANPDLLIFSGDKLFGGVQAGIVLGTRQAVTKLRKHPMMRLLRTDKLTISVVCHQLRDTLLGKGNPFSQLACTSVDELRARAQNIVTACPGLKMEVAEAEGYVGGGSLPQERRPSVTLVIDVPNVSAFARTLRLGDPPLIGYVRNKKLYINLASVFPSQDPFLIALLNKTGQ